METVNRSTGEIAEPEERRRISLKTFNFAALHALDDGRISVAIDDAISRLHADMEDRPGLKKARTITVTIGFVPIPDDRGRLDEVDVTLAFKETVPKRDTKSYRMEAVRGQLHFNDMSPDNPGQGTLDELGRATSLRRAGGV